MSVPGGSIALFGRDGFLRARSPPVEGMYDKNVLENGSVPGLYRAWKQAPAGTYEVYSSYDAKERIYGYRALENLPLVIAVGLLKDDVLAAFEIEVVRIVTCGSIATLIIGLLLLMLLREQRQRVAREQALAASNVALAEAESSFRGVFESSPDVLSVLRVGVDDAITVELMNAATTAAFDSEADYRGKMLKKLVPPTVFARISGSVGEVVASGKSLRKQDYYFDDDRVCEVIVVPLSSDQAGRVTRTFLSVRDISHLRRAETARAMSEARYRLLADNTTDMITHMDLTGRRLFVSPACRDLLGYTSKELVGTSPHQMIHPEDAEKLRTIFADFATGRIDKFVNENRLRHRDGHWIWVEASLKLLRDASGRPSSVVGAMRNITKRRHAEAVINTSETRFRLLAENVSELIILGNDDGSRSYVSPASMRLLGYTPEELRDILPPSHWVHPDDLGHFAAALGQEASEVGVVLRLRRKDAVWIWAEAMFGRMPGAGSGGPTIIATFRDVSARQSEAEALRQAKEAAELASQAKTDFLATMSHEIRTPLNAVLGYADLLLSDEGIAGERRLGLERIQNAGSALRTVVDDILDFSKIEAGHVELELRSFRPGALIENALSIVGGFAREKRLDLVVDLGADVPSLVTGDHDRLRQILLNLLNNAIKFTSAGSVTLVVRVLRRDTQAAKIRFTVQDTGKGVPRQNLAGLFQRFSQVDGSISREFGGTGLGLAICKRLVEVMGGEIGVSSELGRGSAFWFDVALPVATSMGNPVAGPRRDLPPGRSMSVLLVEDQEINRSLASAVLEASGHEVDAVKNGAAAVAAVIAKRYDIVLMDVQMPIMNGIDATYRIRALDHVNRMVPIIAMTANVLPSQVAEFERAGMNGHIGKPFRREELLAIMTNCADAIKPVGRRDHARGPRILDLDTFHSLGGVVGHEAVRELLSRTIDQLATIAVDGDGASLAALAHGFIAAAGTLGLVDLSMRLRDLETACLSGGAMTDVFHAFRASLTLAQEVVADLVSVCPTDPRSVSIAGMDAVR